MEVGYYEQDKKFSIKAASADPPKELDESIRKLLSNSTVQFFDPAGKLVCELWLAKELPAQATAEQVKSGITYRELKETQLIGAVRFDQGWPRRCDGLRCHKLTEHVTDHRGFFEHDRLRQLWSCCAVCGSFPS